MHARTIITPRKFREYWTCDSRLRAYMWALIILCFPKSLTAFSQAVTCFLSPVFSSKTSTIRWVYNIWSRNSFLSSKWVDFEYLKSQFFKRSETISTVQPLPGCTCTCTFMQFSVAKSYLSLCVIHVLTAPRVAIDDDVKIRGLEFPNSFQILDGHERFWKTYSVDCVD